MTVLVPIALFGFVPVALVLYWLLPPRRAALVVCIAGTLFLPMIGFKTVALPEVSKTTVISYGLLLGTLLFDGASAVRFRPRLIDLPMLIWCATPFFSSIANDLGPYEGASAAFYAALVFGVPYFVGRIHFTDLRSLREAAIAILIGGIVYVPLCLWEIRMSPQLNRYVYGFHPEWFGMSVRYGGYRPMVFMQNGLMLGMWMTAATLMAIWLWGSCSLRRLRNVPMGYWVALMLVTTVLCKSVGSLVLLVLGMIGWKWQQWTRSRVLVLGLIAMAPIYMAARIGAEMSGGDLVAMSKDFFGAERAGSLQFRIDNENLLVKKAMERPLLGWGRFGRSRVYDKEGRDISITDGMWVIALGQNGLVGLVSFTAVLLLPVLLLSRRLPVEYWSQPVGGAAAALGVLMVLYMIDNIPNAMFNPVYYMVAGGLSGMSRPAIAAEIHGLVTPIEEIPGTCAASY